MHERMRITSEDDAWQILEQIVNGQLDPGQFSSIEFDGWTPEILYFPREPIPHSVSQTSVRAIDDFYDHLSRLYALLVYKRASIRLLKSDDRRALDIKLVVVGDSSGYSLPDKEWTAVCKRMLSKMSGRQIMTVIILTSLLFVGYTTYKLWVQEQTALKKVQLENETERFRTAEEARRMEILTRLMERIPQAQDIKSEGDKAKLALTRAGASKPQSRILGVDMTGDEAQQLIGQERRQGEGRRLDGRFTVVEITADTEDGWVVKLAPAEGAMPFDAEVARRDLTTADVDAVFFLIREGAPIDLQVNAWFVGERIRRAVVVRAQLVEDSRQSASASEDG